VRAQPLAATDSASDSSRRSFLGSLLGAAALGFAQQGRAGASVAGGEIDLQKSQLEAARRNALCSANNAVGVGLRGEYFAEEDCRGLPVLVRTDPTIDFDATLEWPERLAKARPRSVRWTGWVKAPLTGAYRFHLRPASGTVVVARAAVSGPGAERDAVANLNAGRFYPIALRIAQLPATPSERTSLEWTAPHGARYVVPRSLLHLPSDTVTSR
jgi:hypothetical protein